MPGRAMANVKDKPADTAAAKMRSKVVEVPRPTPDQLQFLKRTSLRPSQYDRTIVVGGPSRLGKPSA